MTPEEHNKLLAIGHFIEGGLMLLIMLFASLFFGTIIIASILSSNAVAADGVVFGIFFLIFMLFYMAIGVPSLIAGYGLLKRKSWAKTWSIISAVLCATNFPIGIAVCVYTFWFLFSDPGKILYDKNYVPPNYYSQRGLYDAPNFQDFSAREQTEEKREYDFTGTYQPPDWR